MSNLLVIRANAARAFLEEGPKSGRAWSTKMYAYDFEEDGMLFLHWYDDNPKKNTVMRLAEACGAWEARFGTQANLILVNEVDALATRPGCEVRVERRISKDNYQVGKLD